MGARRAVPAGVEAAGAEEAAAGLARGRGRGRPGFADWRGRRPAPRFPAQVRCSWGRGTHQPGRGGAPFPPCVPRVPWKPGGLLGVSRDGSGARRGSSGGRAALAQRTAGLPRRGMWEEAARPPGSSRRLCVGLLVSRPLGLGEMYTDDVGGFVNPYFSPGSIGFFFFLNSPRWRTAIDFSPPPMESHRFTVIPNYAT